MLLPFAVVNCLQKPKLTTCACCPSLFPEKISHYKRELKHIFIYFTKKIQTHRQNIECLGSTTFQFLILLWTSRKSIGFFLSNCREVCPLHFSVSRCSRVKLLSPGHPVPGLKGKVRPPRSALRCVSIKIPSVITRTWLETAAKRPTTVVDAPPSSEVSSK
jgi:hypothetical protein